MSWQNRWSSWLLKKQLHPEKVITEFNIAKIRSTMKNPTNLPHPPTGWQIRSVQEGALIGEWTEPKPNVPLTSQRVILYLHGGGYYFCSARTHQALTCCLAKYGEARVFSLDYPLAPEHPFPAALVASVAACQALYAMGIAPENLIIAGDSAGGGLAVSTMVRLRELGLPLPAAAVLFSPWTDLACTGDSLVTNTGHDVMFHGGSIPYVAKLYVGEADPKNPLISPIYADLSGLPPLFVQVSDTEVLLDDSRRLVEIARAAGVKVDFTIWPRLPHVWQLMPNFLPEAHKALLEAGKFIQANTKD